MGEGDDSLPAKTGDLLEINHNIHNNPYQRYFTQATGKE
jgi:hypothetical protein